jgi:hypothetical protein
MTATLCVAAGGCLWSHPRWRASLPIKVTSLRNLPNRPRLPNCGQCRQLSGAHSPKLYTGFTLLVRPHALGAPHTYSFTFSFNCTVNNCAVRSRVCWIFRTFVQLKFLDCVTFETAEDLTAQFTLDCSVCCVLKAEAHFVYIFNAVNIK